MDINALVEMHGNCCELRGCSQTCQQEREELRKKLTKLEEEIKQIQSPSALVAISASLTSAYSIIARVLKYINYIV